MKLKIWRLLPVVAVLIWLLVGIYGVIFNISYIDEAKYLIKGWLIFTKQISYYSTPEFFYQHMPGGWLWYGLGQKMFGPSLLAGRVQSFLTGLLVVGCSYLLGKRLAGKRGGVITIALLSLAPVTAFYYSAAVPQSLVILMLLLGFIFLYDGLVKKSSKRFLLASSFFSLAFIVRENFLFTLILYLGFLAVIFRNKLKPLLKHLMVIAITLGIFILPGYPGTIEVLRNFPKVSYLLPISSAEKEVLSLYWKEGLQNPSLYFLALRDFGVIFHAWSLVILWLVIINWQKIKNLSLKISLSPKQLYWRFLIGITGFNFLIHSWAAFKLSPRAIVSYFAYVAPLTAVVMAKYLCDWMKTKKKEKMVIMAYAILLLLVPVGLRFARIFAIPTRNPDLRMITKSADKLQPIVKGKDKIVWVSEPISLYLAGRVSYYPLINHTGFYKLSNDTKTVKALGFWNQEMLEEWLNEADLVVIGDAKLQLLMESHQGISLARFIKEQLGQKFDLIDRRNDLWPGGLSFYLPKGL
ncbi:ArnT family glycosyltransferase [Patescibacteria group bacterium]